MRIKVVDNKRIKKTKSIVTGHMEKIGQKVFTEYSSAITELIRGHQGIYALYKKDKLYYVGLASNLKNRIKHHLSDRHKNYWTHFSLYIIRHEEHIKEIESLVLRISYPKGNSVKGNLRQSNDLRPVLKSKMREQWERQFNDIIGGRRKKSVKKTLKTMKVDQNDLPLKGLLRHYQPIYAKYKGRQYKANVLKSGKIKLNGKIYLSPSGLAKSIIDRGAVNGWNMWKYKDQNGNLKSLKFLKN
jgi:hypothetical protein